MRITRREALGRAVRGTFLATIAASLVEGLGGVDPKTGRCGCLFCQAARALERRGRRT